MKKFTIILSVLILFIAGKSLSQLDATFDGDGKVLTQLNIGYRDYMGSVSALQSDGKIVIAGHSSNGFEVLRYHKNGKPDINFGVNGKVTIPVGTGGVATAIAIQQDGKIIVAGNVNGDIVMIRYNTDGSADNAFGTNGKVITRPGGPNYDNVCSVLIRQDRKIMLVGNSNRILPGSSVPVNEPVVIRYAENGLIEDYSYAWQETETDFHGDGIAYAGAIQPDGKIVVAGTSKIRHTGTYSFTAFRYNTDGTADLSFGNKGIMNEIMLYSGGVAYATCVAIQQDGRIVIAGEMTPLGKDGCLTRLNPNGTYDNTFGLVSIPYADLKKVSSLAIQSDGKIVIAGYGGSSNRNFSVIRFNADRTPDKGFGSNGVVTKDIAGYDDELGSVAIQQDGKIVVAGYSKDGTFSNAALARYNNPNGSLDNTFNLTGIVVRHIGSTGGKANAVAVQNDGKIVVAGFIDNSIYSDLFVARYNANGSPDAGFNLTGKAETNFGGDFVANAVLIQKGGKIVVAGKWYNGANYDFALVRYNADGTLDYLFSPGGLVTTAIGTKDDIPYSVLEVDSKLIVAGTSFNGTNYDIAIARYNLDGTPDNTFSLDGKTTKNVLNGDDYAYSIATQSDGKIVVAGHSYNGSNNDFAVSRFLSNGDPDNTFGTGGTVRTEITKGGDDYGRSVKIQADGKIIVGGYSYNNLETDFAVVRYNAKGGLIDNTFNNTGIATAYFSGHTMNFITSMALQADGRIVMAGYTKSSTSSFDFAVLRYMQDGKPDATFGIAGKVETDFGKDDVGNAIALQQDGKIVVAGTSNNNFAIARYNNNTTLLTSLASNITDSKLKGEQLFASFTVFPNPVISNATISFHNDAKGNVTLELFDISGKKIKAIFNGISNEGMQRIQFSRENIKPGMYFLRLSRNGETVSKRILVK